MLSGVPILKVGLHGNNCYMCVMKSAFLQISYVRTMRHVARNMIHIMQHIMSP